MADDSSKEPTDLEQSKLRHVETDVLIPKLVREKAKERCKDYVKGAGCCTMNTLSLKSTLSSLRIVSMHKSVDNTRNGGEYIFMHMVQCTLSVRFL